MQFPGLEEEAGFPGGIAVEEDDEGGVGAEFDDPGGQGNIAVNGNADGAGVRSESRGVEVVFRARDPHAGEQDADLDERRKGFRRRGAVAAGGILKHGAGVTIGQEGQREEGGQERGQYPRRETSAQAHGGGTDEPVERGRDASTGFGIMRGDE